MKRSIIKVLNDGYSFAKRPLDDYIGYLHPLKYIFKPISETNLNRGIESQNNSFWNFENDKNRLELISDIQKIRKNNISDVYYFHIINRFENGDRYGIDISEKERGRINDSEQ